MHLSCLLLGLGFEAQLILVTAPFKIRPFGSRVRGAALFFQRQDVRRMVVFPFSSIRLLRFFPAFLIIPSHLKSICARQLSSRHCVHTAAGASLRSCTDSRFAGVTYAAAIAETELGGSRARFFHSPAFTRPWSLVLPGFFSKSDRFPQFAPKQPRRSASFTLVL